MAGISTIVCDRCETSVEHDRHTTEPVEGFPGVEYVKSFQWNGNEINPLATRSTTVDLCYECAIEHELAVRLIRKLERRVLAEVIADPAANATERIADTIGERINSEAIQDRAKVRDEIMGRP